MAIIPFTYPHVPPHLPPPPENILNEPHTSDKGCLNSQCLKRGHLFNWDTSLECIA